MAAPDAPPERIGGIDAARGVSILLIVMLHARLVLEGVEVSSDLITRVDDVAGFARLPLFFAASGLFAARWTDAPWRELWARRLLPLVWVFVVWQPVVLAYKLAEAWLIRGDIGEVWDRQLLYLAVCPLRPVGELWFLWALCVFFVLLRATARVPAALRVGGAAALSCIWFGLVEPAMSPATAELLGSGWGGVAKYFVFFAAAAALSSSIRRAMTATPVWLALSVVTAWAVVVTLIVDARLDTRWWRLVLGATGVAAGLALGRVLNGFVPLRRLGRSTLPVYVAHLALLVAGAIALQTSGLLPPAVAHPTTATVIAAALAVAGALALHAAASRTRAGRALYAPPPRLAHAAARDARPVGGAPTP